MAIFLLHGDSRNIDAGQLNRRLKKLLDGIPTEGNLNYSAFDLSEPGSSVQEVVASALTVPFLGGNRTVVARNTKVVEKYFRQKDEDSEPSSGGESESIIRSIGQLTQLPDDSLLIFIEESGHLDGRTAFYKALKKAGCKMEEFKSMWFDPAAGGIDTVTRFIRAEATRMNLRIDEKNAELIAYKVGPDSSRIVRELEKLAIYAGPGASITPDMIHDSVAESYEAVIFNLVDAIGMRNMPLAMEYFSNLMEHDTNEQYIITMITRQLRLIVRVREALAAGSVRDQKILGPQLGESTFTIGKILRQTNRFPRLNYPDMLDKIIETDYAIKRGKMAPRLALETLIVKLISSR
ncbi:MAG TPA: DNA polymerase III subunit delta [bacterium]|jgi:DNA polymerase-3 subunit delta